MSKKTKKPQGFAAMAIKDPIRLREISRFAGIKAQDTSKPNQWTAAEAKTHGTKGAKVRWGSKGNGK